MFLYNLFYINKYLKLLSFLNTGNVDHAEIKYKLVNQVNVNSESVQYNVI